MSDVLTVYIDILFITNGTINSALLLMTYRFLGIRPKAPRFIGAVLLSTVYGLTVCLPGMSFFSSTFFKTLSALLISIVAFAPHLRKGLAQGKLCGAIRLGKCTCIFAFVSFTYGAAVTSFQYAPFARDAIYVNNGEIYYNIPVPYLLLALLILISAQSIIMRIREKQSLKSGILTATLTLGKRSQTLRLLADSGNLARDLLSGDPVVFVDPSALSLLPKDSVKAKDMTELFSILSQCEDLKRRLSLIPCSAAWGSGVCTAFRPQGFRVEGEEVSVLIALPTAGRVSGEGFDGIFNPNILQQKGDAKCSNENLDKLSSQREKVC